ncbi:alpha/beta hydrolase [Vallitalea pronyensis]|uniref:Alpha/beta hydrolase n=1 Tax=Vallitalea pronyensis TaxID=1348613 RepID=A0A8J8MME3_9FIRM|nr:alpha/beta fold hydrolase [Vallitalea pronyensis]QUI24345.1 alpha/beta hydrolase [Vallitalea pronyensis]
MFEGNAYWKNYMVGWFGEGLIDKWYQHVKVEKIQSNHQDINLEVYDTGNKDATTFIFAHGIAGYARVLLPFTMPLFECGYNLVVPDMQGYGYNDGLKGDFEWNAHKQNLKDCIDYAKKRFTGKIVIGGASMGGPLAYAAACEREDIDGLVCWCLWDFSDREFMLNETNTKGFTYVLIPILKWVSKYLQKVRIKTYSLISYDTLTDSKEFNDLIKRDPQAGTHITLKGAASLVLQSKPYIPHDKFNKKVLILQPEKDEMTPKYYTEKVYKKLGSKEKKYIEIKNSAHFPVEKEYYLQWKEAVNAFLETV